MVSKAELVDKLNLIHSVSGWQRNENLLELERKTIEQIEEIKKGDKDRYVMPKPKKKEKLIDRLFSFLSKKR